MNNQFGYINFYMGQEELEKFISTQVEEKYRDKPIKLTDVIFNKEDGSIDYHFITLVGDGKDEQRGRWSYDRTKINPLDVCNLK